MSIFLSYKREDTETVLKVHALLVARGYDVFIDRKMKSGVDFREKLTSQLHQSSCVLTFWSKDSINSRCVIDEAEYGLERGILVPVLLDNIRPPFGFGDINAANLKDWNGDENQPEIKKVLEAIDWVTNATTDSVQEIQKGLNKILDPIPSKDYREFKSTQNNLNESVTEVLRELVEINQKATEKMIKQSSMSMKVAKAFLYTGLGAVALYMFYVVSILEGAFTYMSQDLSMISRSIGSISNRIDNMSNDSTLIRHHLISSERKSTTGSTVPEDFMKK